MKKHLMTVLCMASAALTSFASQMASQPWVEKRLHEEHTNIISEIALSTGWVSKAYVDQEVEVAKRYTDEKIASLTRYGEATVTYMRGDSKVTLTLENIKAEYKALRIVESNVSGMTNGTEFAYDDFGNYCNYQNPSCHEISSSIVTNGTVISGDNHYEYITNGVTVVTNLVGRFTNTLFVTRLRFDVNGLHFLGRGDYSGRISCAEMDRNSSNRIVFAPTVVTQETKTHLLTPINKISFLDFLFPSCYAAWAQGNVENKGSPYPKNGGVWQKYDQHYIWNESTLRGINVLTASITDAGGHLVTVKVPIGMTLVDIPSGTKLCDLTEENFPFGDDFNTIAREVCERISRAGFGDSIDLFSDAILGQIEAAFSGVSWGDHECAHDKEKEIGKLPAPDPNVDPNPEPDNDCTHANCYGNCDEGWRCSSCLKQLKGPCSHNYEEGGGSCAKCFNSYLSCVCGRKSLNPMDHIFPAGAGGTEKGCFCKYKELTSSEHKGSVKTLRTDYDDVWFFNDEYHWKWKQCQHCFGKWKEKEKKHIEESEITHSREGCVFNVKCTVCAWHDEPDTAPHQQPYVFDAEDYEFVHTPTTHMKMVYWKCGRCGQKRVKEQETDVGFHTFKTYPPPVYANDEQHWFTNMCSYCQYRGNPVYTNHSNVSESSWTQLDNMLHYKTRRCLDCNHDISNLEAKHDRYDDAVQNDHFDTYPQTTNFWCKSHSSGGSGEEPKNWWLDQTGGHIGQNHCNTCLGKYHDLTWRACKYESVGSFRISDTKYVATCDICGIQLESPRLANCMRYLNREYHAEFLCREIGGSASRCTPYLNAEQHDLDDDGYCWICDTIVSDQPGNVEFDTNVLPSQFDGGWGTGWPTNPDQIIGH